MEEKKKELIKKIDQLKPIDLLMIQNVADVLITRDKIETSGYVQIAVLHQRKQLRRYLS